MKLQFVILAHSAYSDPGSGFTSALGIGLQALASVPLVALPEAQRASVPVGSVGLPVKFSVVARLLAKRIEFGKSHVLEISVQGEDGDIVFQAKIAVLLTEKPMQPFPQGREQPIVAAVDILLPVKRFGRYSVEVTVDGDHKGSEPFEIIQATLVPAPPPS